MIPSRNELVVTGSEDVEGLERMASLAEEQYSRPRYLSGIPVVLDDNAWSPFSLAEPHPLAPRYRSLWHLTREADYSRQGRLLADRYAGQGVDLFAANVLINPDREWATTASWGEGIVSLLPKTQLLVFSSVSPDEASVDLLALGEWDRVREVVGDLMEPLGLYPERYLVRSFPTADQLEAIRVEGEDLLSVFRQRWTA
jgi:hypothetical protein